MPVGSRNLCGAPRASVDGVQSNWRIDEGLAEHRFRICEDLRQQVELIRGWRWGRNQRRDARVESLRATDVEVGFQRSRHLIAKERPQALAADAAHDLSNQ